MVIGCMELVLYAPWVHSLKEKRMIVKSICAKASNKFNISVAEIGMQDVHQKINIGIACVTNEGAHAESILENVLNFIEVNTEAEIVRVDREVLYRHEV